MEPPADVYVFGDQTLDVLKNLQSLLLIADNALLTEFLNEAFHTVQHEISRLPSTQRHLFPQAETFGLLLDVVQKGRRHAALDSACVCIYEIAYYI